tara:strand:+ start:2546 stop:4288 length:1743 start_codon:yes stop_codon:yes gene_type:complete
MKNKICLDNSYSTTRILTKVDKDSVNSNLNYFIKKNIFGRHGDFFIGGLKTNGYYKESFNKKPLISVVTISYNDKYFLEETIISVLSQNYDNIEFIIIDGASIDGTKEVLEKYDDKIDLWISEPDLGIYDAINKGIQLSTGVLIKNINSGDLLNKNSIKTYVKNYIKNNNKDFVYNSYIQSINEDDGYRAIWTNENKIINGYNDFNHPSWLVPKSIYEKYGFYSLEYSISSDYEIYLRLLSNGVIFKTIKEPLVSFRKGGISFSRNGLSEVYSINKMYFGFFNSTYDYYKRNFFKYLQILKEKYLNNKINKKDLICFIHIENTEELKLDKFFIKNFIHYYNLSYKKNKSYHQGQEFYSNELQLLLNIFPFIRGFSGYNLKSYSGYDKFAPNIKFITFLRNPITRYLEQYKSISKDTAKKSNYKFINFVEEKKYSNIMTKKFSPTGNIDEAIENIKKLNFIGLFEELDLSLEMMKETFKNLSFEYVVDFNFTVSSEDLDSISNFMVQKAIEENKNDLVLYDYVKENIFIKNKNIFLNRIKNEQPINTPNLYEHFKFKYIYYFFIKWFFIKPFKKISYFLYH